MFFELMNEFQIQWERKKSFFHGTIGLLPMDSIHKIDGMSDSPLVTLVGERELKLEFPTLESKKEFYSCFPLLKEGIEVAQLNSRVCLTNICIHRFHRQNTLLIEYLFYRDCGFVKGLHPLDHEHI